MYSTMITMYIKVCNIITYHCLSQSMSNKFSPMPSSRWTSSRIRAFATNTTCQPRLWGAWLVQWLGYGWTKLLRLRILLKKSCFFMGFSRYLAIRNANLDTHFVAMKSQIPEHRTSPMLKWKLKMKKTASKSDIYAPFSTMAFSHHKLQVQYDNDRSSKKNRSEMTLDLRNTWFPSQLPRKDGAGDFRGSGLFPIRRRKMPPGRASAKRWDWCFDNEPSKTLKNHQNPKTHLYRINFKNYQ